MLDVQFACFTALVLHFACKICCCTATKSVIELKVFTARHDGTSQQELYSRLSASVDRTPSAVVIMCHMIVTGSDEPKLVIALTFIAAL